MAADREVELRTPVQKFCKNCHNIPQSGPICVTCGTMFHKGCVKYIKNIEIIDEKRVICCEITESKVSDDPASPEDSFTSLASLNEEQPFKVEIVYLKKLICEKNKRIQNLQQTVDILKQQVSLLDSIPTKIDENPATHLTKPDNAGNIKNKKKKNKSIVGNNSSIKNVNIDGEARNTIENSAVPENARKVTEDPNNKKKAKKISTEKVLCTSDAMPPAAEMTDNDRFIPPHGRKYKNGRFSTKSAPIVGTNESECILSAEPKKAWLFVNRVKQVATVNAILQNLGKVDRTADDIFDEHLQNFTKQQNLANKLQKEFNNYIRCVRACQAASKSFLEAVSEVYETNWSGHDLLYVQTQSVDMLYQDFSHKLGEQVLLPLNTYQSQFPEMKKKIDKRGRKLVDYDAHRHNYQTLQSSMSKKRDETKLVRGREALEEAKRTYEVLNSELHDELPALHDSRILFLVTNLQTLFNTEQIFHAETAKAYSELESIVDKLATDSQRGSYTVKKTNGASLPRKITNDNNSTTAMNNISIIKNNFNNQAEEPTTPSVPTTPTIPTAPSIPTTPIKSSPTLSGTEPSTPTTPSAITSTQNHTGSTSGSTTPVSPPSSPPPPITLNNDPSMQTVTPKPEVNGNATPQPTDNQTDSTDTGPAAPTATKNNLNKPKNVEELYDIPVGASTENLPPGVLYRVKATYKYNREDVDELSFDVGEIIQVVEYDDPEEQEEGWLMGLKEQTGEKGMFPANFTKPL